MARGVRKLFKVFGIVAAVFAVLLIALQLTLNSAWMRSKLDAAASSAMPDGELRYGRLHFGTFPFLSVEADSLSVTYPHGLFSAYDALGVKGPLLEEGRGAEEDTLVAVGRLDISVNPWKLFCGRIRVRKLSLEHPRIFYHSYTQTASNLDIFAKGDSAEAKDSSSKSVGLPWISLGNVGISDNPRIVYTSRSDTVHARVLFDAFRLRGDVRIKKDILASKLRRASLELTGLALDGRLPSDTLAVSVGNMSLANPSTNRLKLSLNGDVLYFSPSFGSLHVPAALEACAGFHKHRTHFEAGLERLDADIAYVPLHAEGCFRKYEDHSWLKASAGIDSCSIGTVLDKYAGSFVPRASDLRSDAVLKLSVSAEGNLSDGEFPESDVSVSIPSGHFEWLPNQLKALLDLDASAHLDKEGDISADVRRCHFRSNGVKLDLDGDGRDLIGRDPVVAARLGGFVLLDSVGRYFPAGLDLNASGSVDMDADINAHLNELEDYIFNKTRIACRLTSDRLRVNMPSNGISAYAQKTDVDLSSAGSSLKVSAGLDSLFFAFGDTFSAGIRGMSNKADVRKVENNGRMVPYLSFTTEDERLNLCAAESRFDAENALVSLEAMRRVRRPRPQRKRFLDSLQRVYPGVPRDSLFAKFRASRPVDDLASKDFKVSLDSSLVALLNRWHPGGLVSLENASVVTPALPLRTTLNAFDMALDDDDAQIATCNLSCGSSDVDLTGSVGGFRRFIRNRGPLKFNFNVHSNRLNANELLVAMQQGGPVTDSLSEAKFDPSAGEMRAVVVPKNLRGAILLSADDLEYSSFEIRPASATINIRDRVLQIKDVDVSSNVGRIKLEAFYSTRSKSDISAGIDMHLIDMPAYDIIHTLPTVDTMMPALKSFEGNLGCDLSVTTKLDTNLNVITPSMNGLLRISGEDLFIKNAGSFRKVTRLLMFKDKNIGRIQDLYVDAVIGNNRVEIYPFVLGVDKYKLALAGTQGFNGSMRYNISILESFLPFRFGINIYGNPDKLHFSIGRNRYRGGKVPSFTADLDTMQVNLLDVIRNVYDKGVQKAMDQMNVENKRLERARLLNSYSGAPSEDLLSREEFLQVDSLLFAMQAEDEMRELEAGLDAMADEALLTMTSQQTAWLEEHPWAEAAKTRAQQRREERARKKAES